MIGGILMKTRLVGLLVIILLCTKVFAGDCNHSQSVMADFAARDTLSEFTSPRIPDSWGPKPRIYPAPIIPQGCDRITWERYRVVAVAEKYIGLSYRHHHIPSYNDGNGVGLDCSNFTAWIYNYALGIKLNSDINIQAKTAGRQLAPDEQLEPGDLLFIRTLNDSRISHAVIYIDPGHIIDDHGTGVKIRKFAGWYKNHYAYARRIIE